MGIGDKFRDTAEDAVEKVGSKQAKEHLGKAADAAEHAAGGKFEKPIDKGKEAAQSEVDKLSKKGKHKGNK